MVTSVLGCWISVDGITHDGDLHPFAEYFFELHQEKHMFDMKKEPWGIFWKTPEERDAIVEWLKYQGFEIETIHHESTSAGSFSNLGYGDGTYGYGSGTKLYYYWWEGRAKEIKVTFKTTTTVDSVVFPEIIDKKQIEIEKIRKEMEVLTERMKKLENS